jgi:hypothetical protein
MPTISEHPETLDQVQDAIQKWIGKFGAREAPLQFSREPGNLVLLCIVHHRRSDLRLKATPRWLSIERKKSRLDLNLDRFLLSTTLEGEKLCLNFAADPSPEHRFLTWALHQIAETKHPAFQSRILRAFIELEENLPSSTIEQATGAPTDFLVALEALSSAPGTSQLIESDPLLAAKLRGLNRKRQMLEAAGGSLTSEQVAEMLGISRQAVDKRRSSTQLLALTQGRRGNSYPAFQFEEGKTIAGLEAVLEHLKPLDPWMQMAFFTTPNERLDGKTPIQALQNGLVEDAAHAAVGYGEQGAL